MGDIFSILKNKWIQFGANFSSKNQKHFYGRHRRCYKLAIQRLHKAWQHANRSRKIKSILYKEVKFYMSGKTLLSLGLTLEIKDLANKN